MCATCANCTRTTPCASRSSCSTIDSKRFHYFEQLFHATEGWVSATSENMTLHVDMAAKKVAPFPDSIMRSLARMKAAHAQLPRPEAAGRRIAMPGRTDSALFPRNLGRVVVHVLSTIDSIGTVC